MIDDYDRIIITGRAAIGDTTKQFGRFTAQRYLPNGNIDPVFGNGGTTIAFLDTNAQWPFDAALLPDGKIAIVGSTGQNPTITYAILRLTLDGNPDPTFGNQGWVITAIGNLAKARTVAIQNDGKILAGGYFENPTHHAALIRYWAGLSTGITEQIGDVKYLIAYPNPTVGNVMLEYELLQDENVNIQLKSLDGRLLSTITNSVQTTGHHYQSIQLTKELPAGIYLINIVTPQSSLNYKLIKL